MEDWIVCSCCGASIRNTADENVSFGEEPYPHDHGYGMCKRIGWASECFFDARIKVLQEKLSPENVEKFNRMSYAKKIDVVTGMVRKGLMT